MSEPKEINELSGHIVLYAKHWYKRSGNSIEDISEFMRNWSGMSKDYKYSPNHIYEIVLDCFIETCEKWEMRNFMRQWFIGFPKDKESITIQDFIDEMLSAISLVSIRDIDLSTGKDNGLLLKLPEPNYKYLPKPEDSKSEVK